ncbi:MAG: hypothetical protein SFZ02_20070 [bacterium]|nr:hypothetical protein [bacterium]
MASDVSAKTLFLVTDVTHMHEGRVCILGVDDKFKTIRPDLPDRIHEGQLVLPTGVIRPRAVFEMYFNPLEKLIPPHIEDMAWDINQENKFLRMADENKWHNALEKTSFPSVKDIFGAMIHHSRSIVYKQGKRSVGTIKMKSLIYFRYASNDNYGREGYRIGFTDESDANYPEMMITDLTFRYYFHNLLKTMTIKEAVQSVENYLSKTDCYLRIGLTREWSNHHWLQVNGIYTFPDYAKGMCFMDYKQAGITLPD